MATARETAAATAVSKWAIATKENEQMIGCRLFLPLTHPIRGLILTLTPPIQLVIPSNQGLTQRTTPTWPYVTRLIIQLDHPTTHQNPTNHGIIKNSSNQYSTITQWSNQNLMFLNQFMLPYNPSHRIHLVKHKAQLILSLATLNKFRENIITTTHPLGLKPNKNTKQEWNIMLTSFLFTQQT